MRGGFWAEYALKFVSAISASSAISVLKREMERRPYAAG
jgi:hypothetical protein